MFNVIEGTKPEPEAETAAPSREAPRGMSEAARPYDWSNMVFAAQYCERARSEYEERLAG